MTVLGGPLQTLRQLRTQKVIGAVVAVRGLSVLVEQLPLPVGSLVRLESAAGVNKDDAVLGEVVGFEGPRSIIMLLGSSTGVAPGAAAVGEQSAQTVQVGSRLLGRVLDGLGRTMKLPQQTATLGLPLDYPVKTIDDWASIDVRDTTAAALAEQLEAVRRVRRGLPDDVHVDELRG